MVKCRVTRLKEYMPQNSEGVFEDDEGRSVITQCFHVPFSISDTNECALPRGHSLRHQCQEPSVCINTVGSYECVCPKLDEKVQISVDDTADENFWLALTEQNRSTWELSLNILSECPSSSSTHGCCSERAHTKDGMSCRAAFQCPVDPCARSASNQCAASALCTRMPSPSHKPNYFCQCPKGLLGSGRRCSARDLKPEPKVEYDGITPTEETKKNDYCDCTRPVVDACSGFPQCEGECTVFLPYY
jgi:hypothetical protein